MTVSGAAHPWLDRGIGQSLEGENLSRLLTAVILAQPLVKLLPEHWLASPDEAHAGRSKRMGGPQASHPSIEHPYSARYLAQIT